MRSYLAAYLLLPLALVLHCDCQIQFSEATACPGEIVAITCTTPTQTHQWRVLDLHVHRSLAAADWNRAVQPDFPFQFAVIAVMQNGSIISTGTVNFTANLNGTTVSCRDGYLRFPIEQRTTLVLKAPPPVPGTPSVTFPSLEQLRFRWNVQNPDDVDTYFVNISGPDDQCGSRDILHRSTENSYTCSGWSPTGQNYTLSVQAVNCGGEGPASDPVTVYLQKPNCPTLTVSPLYGSSGRLLEIESQANAGPPVFIADGVDSSNEYIFTYGSGSGPLNFTRQCTGSSCQHTFSVPNSSQVQQYTVSVAIRNVVGVGTASAPVTIGMMNEAVAVHLDICVPEVICQFLDGPVAFASCTISFSTDPTYANLSTIDSANGTNIANLTVPLSTELQPNTLYHYDGLAVRDFMWIRVQGTLVSNGLCEKTPLQPSRPHCSLECAIGIGVAMVTAVVVSVAILYICYRKCVAKKGTNAENAPDGQAEERESLFMPDEEEQVKAPLDPFEQDTASVPLLQVSPPTRTTQEDHPAQEEHPPALEEHPPSSEEHPPSSEEHLPVSEEHPPAPEEHPPAPEEHSPASEEHPPALEEHPPVLEEHPPVLEEHPPVLEEHPPVLEEHPPATEEHPPKLEEHPLALEEHSPSSEEHPPASEEHPPASEEHPPAPEEHSPASEEHPPALEHPPAPEEHSPAPEEHPPVPEEHSPTPEEHSPASEEYLPALKEHPPPPEERCTTQNDSPEVRSASPELCVSHPLQPEETQDDSPGINAQVYLLSSFSNGVICRLSSISGQDSAQGKPKASVGFEPRTEPELGTGDSHSTSTPPLTTERTPVINNADEETPFISNAVMETQGAAKGSSEVVNEKRTIARTPHGQSLKRNVEADSQHQNGTTGGNIPDHSTFPIHAGESENGPVLTKHAPILSRFIGTSSSTRETSSSTRET